MKKIIIATLVGTVIYFAFQSLMWMGGFHKDFYTYSTKQDTIINVLKSTLPQDGMYMMPMADPLSRDFKTQQEKLEKTMVGNPWTMIFYHPRMEAFSATNMLKGLLYTLVGVFITVIVIYYGRFNGFWPRFLVSMSFAVFALMQGVFGYMNWWSFPWSFVKPQALDLIFGWAICSVWLAWFVRRKPVTA